jgi:hypothetical protein
MGFKKKFYSITPSEDEAEAMSGFDLNSGDGRSYRARLRHGAWR